MKFKSEIILLLLCLFTLIACKATKEKKAYYAAFDEYLVSKNIDPEGVDYMKYVEDYFEVEKEREKERLLNHPYLKANQVYLSKDKNDNYYVFQVFDDKGRVYIGSSKIVGDHLSFPKEGVITVTDPIVLDLLGFYQIDDNNSLTIERWKTSAYREWVENDIGFVRNDSIYLTGWHYAKPYKHKKKLLAKTHKTDFRMRYAPNLKSRRKPGSRNTTIFLIEEGTFKTNY